MKMFKMTTGGGQALLSSKQGAVKRALLYILTPVFCVALLCGTVFSFSKTDKISANAAEKVVDASCVAFAHDENKVAYYNGMPASSYLTAAGYYNTLTDTNTKLNVVFNESLSGSSGTLSMSQAKVKGTKGASMLYHATVTVPAHATYVVRYNYASSITKSASTSTDSGGYDSNISCLGDDYVTVLNNAKYDCQLNPVIEEGIITFPRTTNNRPGTKTATASMWDNDDGGIIYSNDEDNAKDFKTYFLYHIGMRAGTDSSSASNGFEASVDISVEVKEKCMKTPSNLTTTYDGNNHWLDSFAATTDWIEEDYHLDPNYITISSITYKDNLNNPVSQIYDPATSAAIPDIKNAGVYTVEMKLPSGAVNRWSDGAIGEKTFTITINQKKSVPKPKVDPPITTTPYESAGLPNLITDTGSTPGTFAWNQGEVATAGTKKYGWTFTPTDNNNFTVESDKMELEFLARELSGIAVTAYNPTATVYT
ncbi:MAG: hypothetical protein K2I17_01870, partial [Clostridia bacterium]|nr:hypothetical protein [Clostridia bacterium]